MKTRNGMKMPVTGTGADMDMDWFARAPGAISRKLIKPDSRKVKPLGWPEDAEGLSEPPFLAKSPGETVILRVIGQAVARKPSP